MDSDRLVGNRFDERMVASIIGWIGIALSVIAVPLLWICYGDVILYIVVYVYGSKFARIWLIFIIIACREYRFSMLLLWSNYSVHFMRSLCTFAVFYFASCILWLCAVSKNYHTNILAVSLFWWWMMLSLWIRLVTVTGEISFYVITGESQYIFLRKSSNIAKSRRFTVSWNRLVANWLALAASEYEWRIASDSIVHFCFWSFEFWGSYRDLHFVWIIHICFNLSFIWFQCFCWFTSLSLYWIFSQCENLQKEELNVMHQLQHQWQARMLIRIIRL